MGYWPTKKLYLCPSCKVLRAYDAETTHCKKCGTPLIRECPECKKDFKGGATNCPYCGRSYFSK